MLIALLFACTTKSDDTQSTSDSGILADTASPTDSTDSAEPPCDLSWEGVIEPHIDGPDTQIHGTSAFGGEQIWMAWALPNDSSTFDIWMAAMGCGGEVEVAPFAVTDSADNELDPALAISGDRLLLVWSTSTSAGLGLRRQVFTLDGVPAGPALEGDLVRGGEVVTGNATLAQVSATEDGFALAGSWGHDDAAAFQAFWVPLDLDGVQSGEAVDAELDTENGQTYVALSVADGEVTLAWQEDSTTSTQPTAVWTHGVLATPGARPAVSGEWAAWDDNVGAVWVHTPAGETLELGLPGFVHSPRLADGDPPMLLTTTVDSGIYGTLQLHTLNESGVVETVDLAATASPSAYGVDLTRVDDQNAVVVWQEGENPAFRLYVEWIALP